MQRNRTQASQPQSAQLKQTFFFVISSFCENLDDKEKDVFGFYRDVPDVTHKQCTDTYRDHPPTRLLLQPGSPLKFPVPLLAKDQHHSSVLPFYSSGLLQLELVVYAPAAIKET